MTNIKTIFALMVVFAIIGMIAFATITMLSMEKAPDQNATPDLYHQYEQQQTIQKPFLKGVPYIEIGVVLAMLGIAIVLVLRALQNKGGGGY